MDFQIDTRDTRRIYTRRITVWHAFRVAYEKDLYEKDHSVDWRGFISPRGRGDNM